VAFLAEKTVSPVRDCFAAAHTPSEVTKAVPKPKRPPIPPLSHDRTLAPSHTALALNLVTEMDLLRLKSIARLYARGLPPDVSWDDLLQEAITRVLTGKRVQPEGVAMVAFLGGVMRSLRADHIRRARHGLQRDDPRWIAESQDDRFELELLDPSADPERALIAVEELDKIRRLFADDPVALRIIDGLAEGLAAEQMRARYGISRTEYDSARKRMRRCLIREGLTCEPK
jgi:RNA polymerase sigma-70 factor (ECF subfamily)